MRCINKCNKEAGYIYKGNSLCENCFSIIRLTEELEKENLTDKEREIIIDKINFLQTH